MFPPIPACFNPYFTGPISKTLDTRERKLEESKVSILILLDLSLKQECAPESIITFPCFNPYFTGPISKTQRT